MAGVAARNEPLEFSYNSSIFPFKVTGQGSQELVIAFDVRLAALLRGLVMCSSKAMEAEAQKLNSQGSISPVGRYPQYAHRGRDLTDALPVIGDQS